MSSIYPRRATPPVQAPPVVVADVENFVSHTLKTTKPLPPITWDNFWTELNWLNVAILTLTPVASIIGAYHTKLRWETALFSAFYYYYTGLGESFMLLTLMRLVLTHLFT
jgi:stearoyl-CoA desaturase (delta-9 desaturase)